VLPNAAAMVFISSRNKKGFQELIEESNDLGSNIEKEKLRAINEGGFDGTTCGGDHDISGRKAFRRR